MRRQTRKLAVLCMLIACFQFEHPAFAQSSARGQPAVPSAPKQQRPQALPLPSTALRVRRVALVHGFVDRVQSFQDTFEKARALMAMADALWKYDEPYARQLFFRTYEELAAQGISAPADSATARKRFLMITLISLVAKHDSLMARYLMNSTEGMEGGAATRIAHSLIRTDPVKAVEFAEQSLNGESLRRINSFLFDLRLKDAAMADAFFSRILNLMVAQPSVDAEALMRLGTYVFNSPAVPPTANTHEMTTIGGQFVVNLTADRPDVPPAVVRAYLDTVVTVLSRPAASIGQPQLSYILGYQVLPRVATLLPNRLAELNEGMSKLERFIPLALTQKSTYEPLAAESYELKIDISLKTLAGTADAAVHDAKCISIAHAFCEAGKFNDALTIAERTKDASARSKLIALIKFRRAADLLNRGEVLPAREIANDLDQSVPRILLFLGLAQQSVKKSDKTMAVELINTALTEAHKLDDPRGPQLLVAAASMLAQIDAEAAQQALAQGVAAFNKKDRPQLSAISWSERVGLKQVSEFSLSVEGVPLDFNQALPALLTKDFDGTVLSIAALKEELVLGPALVSIAAHGLNELGRPADKGSKNNKPEKAS